MEEQKIKITEIKETYTAKRKQKNAAGVYVSVDKKFWRYKKVNYVTGWPRFGHFLLDRLFFYILEYVFAFSFGTIAGVLGYAEWLRSINSTLLELSFYFLLYPVYYFLLEVSSQSSLAKLILGRVVIDEYGNKPTAKQIFIRSVSRIVPFEQLSCFNETGWHDNWSKTYVIRKKDLEDLKVLARLQVYLSDPGTQEKDEIKVEEHP